MPLTFKDHSLTKQSFTLPPLASKILIKNVDMSIKNMCFGRCSNVSREWKRKATLWRKNTVHQIKHTFNQSKKARFVKTSGQNKTRQRQKCPTLPTPQKYQVHDVMDKTRNNGRIWDKFPS